VRKKTKVWVGTAMFVAAAMLTAQAPSSGKGGLLIRDASQRLANDPGEVTLRQDIQRGEILREIDDPWDGSRWLLRSGSNHPGGPGSLTQVADGIAEPAGKKQQAARVQPVIRAGERLIVTENSKIAMSRLQAVALEVGAIGSEIKVRLLIGGNVIRVTVTGTNEASMLAWGDVRR